MIAMLLGWGLSQKAAKLVAYVGVPLLIIAALAGGLWWLRADAYSDGEKAERGRWETKIERAKAEQAKRERTADANLQTQKGRDDAAAAARQQEIDNATRNIPDQGLSARQRARACLELRRQAKASGRPQPAC